MHFWHFFVLFFSRVETSLPWLWVATTTKTYQDLLPAPLPAPATGVAPGVAPAVPPWTSLSTWTAPRPTPVPAPPSCPSGLRVPRALGQRGDPPCHPLVQHRTPAITSTKYRRQLQKIIPIIAVPILKTYQMKTYLTPLPTKTTTIQQIYL